MEEQLLGNYDICIIGAGPAGIITALEYAKKSAGKTVLLIEYGDKDLKITNPLDDSIIVENPVNHHSPYDATNKGLGGTSLTWGGRCVMYDEVDFEDRPILRGGCTWDKSILQDSFKYLSAAAEYFECGEPEFDLNKIEKFKSKRIAENFVEGDVTDSVVERWSMPTRFGDRYALDIEKAANITLIDGFEARSFSDPGDDGNVKTLCIRNIHTKEEVLVKADVYVIAAGTQEATRLLLRNKNLFSKLPGVPASLGKFYQGHLSGKIASVKFYGDPKKTEYGFLKDEDEVYIRRRFQFTNEFLTKSNLLNTAIWLDNPLYFDPAHGSGAMSFMYLAMITPVIGKKLAPPAIAHSITKGKVTGIGGHLWNIVKQLPGSLIVPASIFYKRYLLKRKLPGVFLYSPQNKYALHFHSEQLPDINSCMELGNDDETLLIKYSIHDDDVLSIIKLHEVLDEHLRKHNCGELEYWFDKDKLFQEIKLMSKDGIHQSGTTRIAKIGGEGVVDNDLKVWGTNNIYVCSSSVFPTSGQANPTYFLGVLAVRLAHHLNKRNG